MVSELVGNVVKHAYGGSETGMVVVTAAPTDDQLLITVADEGEGIRPRLRDQEVDLAWDSRSQPNSPEELRMESDERGTTVYASFGLPGRDGA